MHHPISTNQPGTKECHRLQVLFRMLLLTSTNQHGTKETRQLQVLFKMLLHTSINQLGMRECHQLQVSCKEEDHPIQIGQFTTRRCQPLLVYHKFMMLHGLSYHSTQIGWLLLLVLYSAEDQLFQTGRHGMRKWIPQPDLLNKEMPHPTLTSQLGTKECLQLPGSDCLAVFKSIF